jgi:hypothetical protein
MSTKDLVESACAPSSADVVYDSPDVLNNRSNSSKSSKSPQAHTKIKGQTLEKNYQANILVLERFIPHESPPVQVGFHEHSSTRALTLGMLDERARKEKARYKKESQIRQSKSLGHLPSLEEALRDRKKHRSPIASPNRNALGEKTPDKLPGKTTKGSTLTINSPKRNTAASPERMARTLSLGIPTHDEDAIVSHSKNTTKIGTCLALRLLGPSITDRLTLLNQFQSDPVLMRRQNADHKWTQGYYLPKAKTITEHFRVESFSAIHRANIDSKRMGDNMNDSNAIFGDKVDGIF